MVKFSFDLEENDYNELMQQKPRGVKKNTFARMVLLQALYAVLEILSPNLVGGTGQVVS